MQEDSEQIGRFKVRGWMRELVLISKQRGSHAYKKATVARPDIPNTLNREFDVPEPNKVWWGAITYSVPGVQGEHGCSNERRVYLEC